MKQLKHLELMRHVQIRRRPRQGIRGRFAARVPLQSKHADAGPLRAGMYAIGRFLFNQSRALDCPVNRWTGLLYSTNQNRADTETAVQTNSATVNPSGAVGFCGRIANCFATSLVDCL